MSPATHSPRASRPFDSDFATAATTTFATPYSTVPIALRRYAKKTGKDLMSHPLAIKIDNCESPDSVLLILQEEAQAFGEYRKEDPTLINCLSSVVHGFDTISSSPPFNTSSCIELSPAKAIFSAIAVLLNTAGSATRTKYYDDIVELFKRIENFIAQFRIYTEIPPTPAMTDMVITIPAEILSVLALATKQVDQGRFKKFLRRLSGKNGIEVLLRRLDSLMSQESRRTVTQTLEAVYGLVASTRATMDARGVSTDDIQQTPNLIQEMETKANGIGRGQLRQDLRRWLSAPDPWTNHNVARKSCFHGTATWFTQGRTFAEWKSTGSLLWIHGKPGSGKSTLCSTIIQDVQDMCRTGSAALAFFYFDLRDAAKLDARSLLSSIIVQLCNQSDRFCAVLSALYLANDRGSRQPGEDDLIQCLKEMISLGQSPIYIVVDALDESPDTFGLTSPRAEVLKIVRELIDPRVHFCVVSRPEMDIRRILEPSASYSVSLDKHKGQSEDIANYVKFVVHSDSTMREWPEEDKQLVIDTLTQSGNGMFRWASCQLETLRHCPLQNIRRALREVPKTLDATYEYALQGINEEKWEYAYRIFQCLTVSARPLIVEEVAEVFVIGVDASMTEIPEFNARWRHGGAEEAVLSACSSLVAVVNRDGKRVVQFSHFSVQQFLTSNRIANSRHVSNFHILPESAHTFVARACLSVLLQLDDRIDEQNIQDFPFASYAAKHWVDHAQFGNVSSILHDGILRLFDRNRPHFATWIRVYDMDRLQQLPHTHSTDSRQPDAVPLYYAALCGFYSVAEDLLVTHPQDLNARGGRRVTPLHAASEKGHVKVVQVLLKHGADVNAQDDQHRTPLHIAAEQGDQEAVRLLIDWGADLNAENGDRGTPLSLASRRGRLEVVRLLLERGADMNHHNLADWTPLHEASAEGHHDVVRLLFEHGANANAQNEYRRTPLHLASDNGQPAVVKVLFEVGASLDARDKSDWTSLHFASQHGHTEIVQFLLIHETDPLVPHDEDQKSIDNVNAQNNEGQTPLHVALHYGDPDGARPSPRHAADSSAGDKEQNSSLSLVSRSREREDVMPLKYHTMVEILLDHGANLNVRDHHDLTPLHQASRKGDLAIAKLLLENGADVDAHDERGWTPLHFASQQGYLELVRLLLSYDADIRARDHDGHTFLEVAWAAGRVDVLSRYNDGQTVLHIASHHEQPEFMRSLIDAGAGVDEENSDKETPLFITSRNGRLEATKLLLEKGADVNHKDWQERTALHEASENGHLEIVELLLKSKPKAEVDAQHLYKWTPLHLASRTGKDKVAKALLEDGAHVDVRNDSGWTPLHIASQMGHLELVRLLLDCEPDVVNAQESEGETPLHQAAYYGHLEVAKVLLEGGARRHIKNNEDETPLDLAKKEGHQRVVQILLEPEAPVRKDEEIAIAL